MDEDSTIRINVKADASQAEKALSDVTKRVDALKESLSAHEKNERMMRAIGSIGGIALAGSSALSPLVERGLGEKVAKTMQTTITSAVSLAGAFAPLGPVAAVATAGIGGLAGAISSLVVENKKAKESAERAADAIKRAAEAEDRRALSIAVDRRLTYQDVSDMWWIDPDSARKMLERKREPLRRLQAISEEGFAAPLEEIQALAPYLLREELTGLLSSMKGNKGWTDKHAEFFDIFEFAETAKLAASPPGKRGAYGEPVGLRQGQERALYDVATRWQYDDPGIAQWLALQDPAIRRKNIYGRAARYAEEFAAKADAAHGRLDNLEMFLSPAPKTGPEQPVQPEAKTALTDILSRILPAAPQTDALGSVGKGVGGHSVAEELAVNLKKLVDIAERQLSETRMSQGFAVLS